MSRLVLLRACALGSVFNALCSDFRLSVLDTSNAKLLLEIKLAAREKRPSLLCLGHQYRNLVDLASFDTRDMWLWERLSIQQNFHLVHITTLDVNAELRTPE